MRFLDRTSQNKTWGRIIDAAAVLFFAFFVVGPLFFILTSLGQFKFSETMLSALLTSFEVAFVVTAIDLLFGIPLAWLMSRKKFPALPLVDAIIDLPLIIPTSSLGLSIALFWGAQGLGLINPGLGLIIVLHIAFTFSYVVRTVQAAIMEIDPDLDRAAGTLGASPLLSFRSIWMPLFRAGVISGAILAFTRSLGETGATMIVAGAQKTVPILTVYFKNSTPPDTNSAISISIISLVLSAALFFLVQRSAVMRRYSLGRVYANAEKKLSNFGWCLDSAVLLFLFIIVLVPSFYFLKFTDLDFFNIRALDAIIVSFGVALAATAASVVFGFPLALFIASKNRASGVIKLLVEMSMLMPTVTIGLSLSLFWAGKLDEIFVLILAHIAMIFSFFVSPVAEILSDMDKSLIEVARSLGARPFYAFRTVVLPIVKPTVIAGLVVAFMRSVSETGGTLAVSKSIITVPLLIVNLTKENLPGAAASAAALLLAISLLLVFVLRMSQRKKW